mmetsp:Transcript_116868/g.174505  ORF Transcript_116868/g.174505 Transcript_116868/m.174505 type:complete len:121 (+) Transcript_116868:1892-2254(+)
MHLYVNSAAKDVVVCCIFVAAFRPVSHGKLPNVCGALVSQEAHGAENGSVPFLMKSTSGGLFPEWKLCNTMQARGPAWQASASCLSICPLHPCGNQLFNSLSSSVARWQFGHRATVLPDA